MTGDIEQVLGAVAHPGGFLVRRPELSVGVVRAVSRVSGLEIELLARRPLDRRNATERRRATRKAGAIAPRTLLPAVDEGIDLRLGLLDQAGRAHWRYPDSLATNSGEHAGGESGPTHRSVFQLPPAFDEVTLVLAWPEIGFPESVVTVPLPDRAAVERATTSIWDAPVAAVPTDETFEHQVASWPRGAAIETGTTAAVPRVLHRGGRAAVVLTRLVAVGPDLLAGGLSSVAEGDVARTIAASAFGPTGRSSRAPGEAARIRADGPGGSLAVVRDGRAHWLRAQSGSFSGGDGIVSGTQDFIVERPPDDVLDLLVTWPLAGLPDARARIPLDRL
ncbi:hypothetical protein [Saccharothrix sp. NRRL B-16314]|uniref:hypothetical protein n=1 Tax=Saccharothrix sp. NRRL B-16314 TaxID=1463825 RepID=UPI000526081C|nr:hypothetical protein [Saccharothrix sp. NRRL B-16314]